MDIRSSRAALAAACLVLAVIAAACGDDADDARAGGLGQLVTTTTTEAPPETTTSTTGGGGLFEDGATGTPGSGLFTGDVDDHSGPTGAATDLGSTPLTDYYLSTDIDPVGAQALYDACGAGDMQACDTMYLDSLVDSEAEAFGATCGGLLPSADAYCVTLEGPEATGSFVPVGVAYAGSAPVDETEETLVNACGRGGMNACDALYVVAVAGSDPYAYGATCGGRVETNQYCSDLFSLGFGYHQAWLVIVGLA